MVGRRIPVAARKAKQLLGDEIEYMRFNGRNHPDIVNWTRGHAGMLETPYAERPRFYFHTNEGTALVEVGDVIIKEGDTYRMMDGYDFDDKYTFEEEE